MKIQNMKNELKMKGKKTTFVAAMEQTMVCSAIERSGPVRK